MHYRQFEADLFGQHNVLDSSSRFCICGSSIEWSGSDLALEKWLSEHRLHIVERYRRTRYWGDPALSRERIAELQAAIERREAAVTRAIEFLEAGERYRAADEIREMLGIPLPIR